MTDYYWGQRYWGNPSRRVLQAECSFAADLLAAYLEEHGTDSNAVLATHALFEGLAAVAVGQPRESRDTIMRVLGYPYSPFRLGHDLAAISDLQACAEAKRSPSGISDSSSSLSTGTQDSRGWALRSRTPTPQLSRDLNDYFASTVHTFDTANPDNTARSIESWLAAGASMRSGELGFGDALLENDLILSVAHAQPATWLLEPTPAEGVFRHGNGDVVGARIIRFRKNFALYVTDDYKATGVGVLADVDLLVMFFRPAVPAASRRETARVVSQAITDTCLSGAQTNGDMLLEVPIFSARTVREITPVLRRMGLDSFSPTTQASGALSNARSWTVLHASQLTCDGNGLFGGRGNITERDSWLTPNIGEVLPPLALDVPFAFTVTHRRTGRVLQVGWIATPE